MRDAFTIDISTDNVAFEDDPCPELARILRRIADKIEEGQTQGAAVDVNGNKCGTFRLMRAEA